MIQFHKLKLIPVLLFLGGMFLSVPAFSQEKAIIRGVITNNGNKPVQGVNISVFGLPGGVSSGPDGSYELKVNANEQLELVFSFIGYKTSRQIIQLFPGETRVIDQRLEVSETVLPAVEVKEEKYKRNSFTRIDPKTVGQIPNASGNFEAVLKTMPGVVSNNELTSQYSVRGGNFDENLVYVNDIEIYRPFLVRSGQQEGLSFINSDLVSGINFSAGGFEANYGDKLSSVLDIKYKKPTKFAGSAYASLLGGGLHLEGINKKKNLGYLLGVRYKSNSYLFKSLETKGEYKPVFADVQGLLSWDIDDKTELSFLGNFSMNKYQIIPENRQTEFGTINQALRLTIYFDGQEVDKYQTYTGALTLTRHLTDSIRLKLIASAYRSFESESFDIQGQYYIDELEKDLSSDNFGDVAFNRGIGTFLEHARNDLDATVYSLEHKGYADKLNSQLQWGVRYQHEII
nr:carboxypeptidase-like regulatory domain-containing protein [Bacteroidia bacterium]